MLFLSPNGGVVVLVESKGVFIHVPKTAGVSISEFFQVPYVNQGHWLLDEYEGWTPDFFKFAFVRNPWDRLVSSYFYFLHGGRSVHDRAMSKWINQFQSFKHFVLALERVDCSKLPQPHLIAQTHWLDDRLDFIGRFESLQKDFNSICERIQVTPKELPKTNTSKRRCYWEYYDDESQQIAAHIYQDDLRTLDYEFGQRGGSL